MVSAACRERADHIGRVPEPQADEARPTMTPRLRKLIGTIALFVLVITWALLAMAIAQFPAIRDSAVLSVGYYVVAGLGWVLPAMPLISWMSRPRRAPDQAT